MLAWSLTGWGAGGLRSMSTLHRCRLCGAQLTRTFVDLGMSPLCESYVPEDRLDEAEVFYPLHVRLCEACLLVQLPAYVSGEHIFSDYAYFSSYSDSWVAHAKRYAEAMTERLAPDARQPRHRGGQQRRLSPAALPGRGHPGARRRAGRERGRGGPGPGHPDRGPVPGGRHRPRDSAEVRPGGPGGGEQCLRPRARHQGLRGRAARAGQGRGHGDAGIPAPAPPHRAPAVRHDLPRALLVPVAADRLPCARDGRVARGGRRRTRHARRFAPRLRPSAKKAEASRPGGSRRSWPPRRPPGCTRSRVTMASRPRC